VAKQEPQAKPKVDTEGHSTEGHSEGAAESNHASTGFDLGGKWAAFSQPLRGNPKSPSEAVSTLPPPGKAVLAPTPAPAAAPATTPITDVAAQIAAIRANAATENMINQANREAKVATMGLKAAKDIIG
jgi:hypothetical protein